MNKSAVTRPHQVEITIKVTVLAGDCFEAVEEATDRLRTLFDQERDSYGEEIDFDFDEYQEMEAAHADACPGCGCRPCDGIDEDCDHALGCGFWKANAPEANAT